MILLDATTRKLQVLLAGALATNNSPWCASYADIATTTFAMSAAASQLGNTNGVTAVDVLSAPAASTSRQLKYFNLFNADTAAITATVRYNDNGTLYTLVKVTLAVGEQLVYNQEAGWQIFDAAGNLKTANNFARGQIPGTATNDVAAAGNIGELVQANVVRAAGGAATSGVAANITSVSLSPGDWSLTAIAAINYSGGTATQLGAGLSTTSATISSFPDNGRSYLAQGFSNTGDVNCPMAGAFSLSVTTVVYLVAQAIFVGGAATYYGAITARRAR